MKAKNFAVTVQYGGGFHNFPFNAYADTEGEALARAASLNADLQRGYNYRTGRRGVRPRVMVWKQVEVPQVAFDRLAGDTSNSQPVDNLAIDLGGKPEVVLQRLPLGALEGDE